MHKIEAESKPDEGDLDTTLLVLLVSMKSWGLNRLSYLLVCARTRMGVGPHTDTY